MGSRVKIWTTCGDKPGSRVKSELPVVSDWEVVLKFGLPTVTY